MKWAFAIDTTKNEGAEIVMITTFLIFDEIMTDRQMDERTDLRRYEAASKPILWTYLSKIINFSQDMGGGVDRPTDGRRKGRTDGPTF